MKVTGQTIGAIGLVVVAAVWIWMSPRGVTAQAPAQGAAAGRAAQDQEAVKRGEYLVASMGCHDCHTPQKLGPEGLEPDMSLMLSGHQAGVALPDPPEPKGPWIISASATMTAWAGPWGVSYARNLTPDPETGIGTWTEEQFVRTIKEGRQQGRGRQILPPMPWPVYRNLTEQDLRAMYAYLRTVKPMKNAVPEPVIAEPPQ
jgi:cytochrome c553